MIGIAEYCVEDDEAETRAECQRGDPEHQHVDAKTAQVDTTERDRGARELREDELGRREQEEPEHETRLVR